jgi:hypothetical protein
MPGSYFMIITQSGVSANLVLVNFALNHATEVACALYVSSAYLNVPSRRAL